MTAPHQPSDTSRRCWLALTFIFITLAHTAYQFSEFHDLAVARPTNAAENFTDGGAESRPSARELSLDEREYLDLAERLADKRELRLPTGEAAKRMPLYPGLLSLVSRISSEQIWHGRALMAQAVLAWLSSLIVAAIGFWIADARAAFVAGLTCAMYAPFRYVQDLFFTETLLVFLVVAATLVYLAFGLQSTVRRKCLPGLIGVSAILGLAILTRPNALLVLIPFAVDSALRMGSMRMRVLRVILVLTPALACAAGWAWRNERVIGSFSLSSSAGLNFYLGHNASFAARPGLNDADYDAADRLRTEAGLSESEADRALFRKGLDYLLDHPGRTAWNCLTKVRVWIRPTTNSFGPTLPAVICAVIVLIGAARARAGNSDESNSELPKGVTGSVQPVPKPENARAGELPVATNRRWIGALETNSRASRSRRSARRNVWLAALVLLVLASVGTLQVVLQSGAMLTSAHYVVSFGIPALLLMKTRQRLCGLFIGIVASQLLAAVAFIPLSRLRWTIDWVFIVAIAVAVSHVCAWLETPNERPNIPTPTY